MRILVVVVGLVFLLAAILAGFLYKGDLPREWVDAKYANAASRFLTLDSGARIHYRDEGNPGGEPLVLLHGANASLHTWEPWVELLGDRYRIITLDLPGHGLTGAVPDDDYSTDAFIAAVTAVISPVVTEDLIQRYYELALREGSRDAILKRFGSFREERSGRFDLSALTMPTLVMWGAQDALIPVSTAHRFHDVLPDSTLVIYEDLGHIAMEEDPSRSARDVIAFLDAM